MFLGEYKHNLDYKGRIAVPKKFREGLEGKAILTKGLDGCLFLYSKGAWDDLTERMQRLPLTRADARAFSRYIFGGACEVKFDQLGRIAVPDYLRGYAQLDKEVVMIGVLERIEIWGKERWEKFAKKLGEKGEEIAEKLSEKGI